LNIYVAGQDIDQHFFGSIRLNRSLIIVIWPLDQLLLNFPDVQINRKKKGNIIIRSIKHNNTFRQQWIRDYTPSSFHTFSRSSSRFVPMAAEMHKTFRPLAFFKSSKTPGKSHS
jgi:hypothetical protein